jgi:hypothetical protein
MMRIDSQERGMTSLSHPEGTDAGTMNTTA